MAFLRGASAGGPPKSGQQPGWPGVFIRLNGYVVTYERPIIGKRDKPPSYCQKATYVWSGGRYELLEITLARDPALEGKYSAETLKQGKNPPTEREIDGAKAWLWQFPREPGKLEQVARRLVVLLAPDKAIILDQKGSGANLENVARKFDFAKVKQALAQPPGR
jgi:hypothetical protein